MFAFCVATIALGLLLLTGSPDAQTAERPVRTILASGRLPAVESGPLYFKLVRVSVPPGQTVGYAGSDGMLYTMSGALEITWEGARRTLSAGSAVFTPASRRLSLTAGPGAPAVALHYLLGGAAEPNRAVYGPPATVTELYRSREPLPNLKPGLHEFTMVRVSVEKGVPRPPMHYRSGAALYYVLAGTWTIHMEGRSEPRERGNVQLEPNGFVHTWENVGDATGVLLQANISAEGAPEIIFLPQR
jgi:quercetin dioxygenase-like cupin family protein